MKFKNKSLLKVAALSVVAAFSFGLSLSCISNVNRNNGSVFAADAQATWSYNSNNKTLSCQSVSAYPRGFIDSATQTQVVGRGSGQYEITYNVQGYASGAMQSSTDDFGDFTLVFISGSYERLSDQAAPYGIITAYPNDIDGLDSETPYEIYVNVLPSGDMNEQGSGGVDDENAGTWTWNADNMTLSFQFDDTATAGYVSTSSQTMVHGNGNGSFDIGYDLYGTPANSTMASNDLLASKTITIYDGYYDEDQSTVTGNPSAISGLESYDQIRIKVDVDTSGTMTSDGWRVNDGDLYFYVLADVNPASIDSITWNNSSGNGTGEAILSVTISTNGGSFQQDYQINNPIFNPELEGTSGTTSPNTTVEGISEWSDRYVTVDISNKAYSLGESTQENRYTIIFDGNGSTGGSMPSVEFTSDKTSVDYELPECGYQRDGYIFVGWGFTEDIKFQPGETRSVSSGETIFYAFWAQQLTITFEANGGSGNMDPLVVAKGSRQTVPECSFVREGYSFLCWAVGSPESSMTITPGQSVTVDQNYALYAVWQPDNAAIEIEEDEVVVYVGEDYLMQYKILPEGYEVSIHSTVEQERIAEVFVEGEIFIYGLSAGTTTVTLSDESGLLTKTFTLYVVEPPVPIEPENKVNPQTINDIKAGLDEVGLTTDQANQIKATINSYVDDEGRNYISQSAGDAIKDAISQTRVTTTDDIVAEGQQALIMAVVETGLTVEAGKATSLSDAQEIDKALPEDAHFSVEGEIAEFYQRQMIELFGGEMPTKRITRAGDISRDKGIDIDPKGKSGEEGKEYLLGEKAKYEKMVGFVDNSVDHMSKAALKIRKCSGESVVVQVKSYVTVVKVSSFRDFDKEAADKEFVEAAYKAILLSMQNEVISILEKEHKPSNNAEKEAQYQKELDAVKDYETFEIMVTEVLRQKWVALTGDETYMATAEDKDQNRDSLDIFHDRVFWPLFEAWALDTGIPKSLKDKGFNITLEELTKTTIEESTNRARTFTIHSDLSTNEWVFIGAIAGGAALVITAAAVIPTLLKKKKAKEGIN